MGAKFDFNVKNPVYYKKNIYPPETYQGSIGFDFRTERLLYGRIDRKSNPIYLQDMNLSPIATAQGTLFAVDFVVDAFEDMVKYIKKAAGAGGQLASNSALYDIKAKSAWVDPQNLYHDHILYMINSFITEHIYGKGYSHDVKDFKGFASEFMKYISWQTRKLPVTKTAFMSSILCDPAVSGLVIQLEAGRHDDYETMEKYLKDPNFDFFRNAAKLHGFRVDMWSPWRLVCNIGSAGEGPEINALNEETGNILPMGTKKYMKKYGITSESVFNIYYLETYKKDIELLKRYLYSGYKTFVDVEPYATVEQVVKDFVGGCYDWKSIFEKVERETFALGPNDIFEQVLPQTYEQKYGEKYWLSMYFKIRNMESGKKLTTAEHNRKIIKILEIYRLSGFYKALDYINDQNIGFQPNTLRAIGKFWQGSSDNITSHVMNHSHQYYVDIKGNGYALEVCNPEHVGICHKHEIINWVVQPDGSKKIDAIYGTPQHIHEIPFKVQAVVPKIEDIDELDSDSVDKAIYWYEQGEATIQEQTEDGGLSKGDPGVVKTLDIDLSDLSTY